MPAASRAAASALAEADQAAGVGYRWPGPVGRGAVASGAAEAEQAAGATTMVDGNQATAKRTTQRPAGQGRTIMKRWTRATIPFHTNV